jgi:DNA-directed RNA polymerase subunit RPC12/RpoP
MADAEICFQEFWTRCLRCSRKVVLFEAAVSWEGGIASPFLGATLLQAKCSHCGEWFETSAADWRTGAAVQ